MSDHVKLLRNYTDEQAYFGDRKVVEEIVARAANAHVAGATIRLALVGFGPSAHQHRRHLFEDQQSIVVQIIDREAVLRSLVESLADIPGIGLMTFEAVEVVGGDHAGTFR